MGAESLRGARSREAGRPAHDGATPHVVGAASLVLGVQRAAGNQAVLRLLDGSSGAPGRLTIQRLTVSKLKITAEVGSDDFPSLVEKALGQMKAPGELTQVVAAIKAAADDPAEDLTKLRAGLQSILDGLNQHGSKLNAAKVLTLKADVAKARGAITNAEKKRLQEQKDLAKAAEEAEQVKKDVPKYWQLLQNPAENHGLEVAWLVKYAGFQVAQPHRWCVSGWDQPDGFGISCEIADVGNMLPGGSERLVIHYHLENDGAVKAQSVKKLAAERVAGGNIFAIGGQFQFPPPPTQYSKAEMAALMPRD